MWPYVLRHPITIGSYGVMMAIGFLTAYYLLRSEFRRRKIATDSDADWLIFIAMVSGVVGAKLAYLITEEGHFSIKEFFSGAGLTWHGGLILATISVLAYIKIKKIPMLLALDAIAPELATGYGFGRIGCQLAGDGDYGIHCAAHLPYPLCMAYPKGIVHTTDIVYATPIYESLGSFLLFAFLWAIRKKVKNPGVLFGLYLILAGLMRFLVEFIRQPEGRPIRFWGLRDAQLVSLGEMLLGIIMVVYYSLKKPDPSMEYGVLQST